MDKLKQNAFWVGTAAALGVLVILFAVMVVPKFGTQAALEKKVRTKKTDLAALTTKGSPNIDEWTNRRKQMIASYQKITDFYGASDRHLERWFEGFGGGERGTFMARYREEIGKLELSLTEKKTEIGVPDSANPATRRLGFNWEEPLPQQWDEIIKGGAGEEARVLKELQKRFWTRQRVATAVLKGDVKVTRIHDFRFFRRLANVQTPVWEAPAGNDAVAWPGIKTDQPGQMPRNYLEYDLPNELGKTFTFGFALVLPYSEVPKIIKEILNPEIEPRNETGSDRLLVNLLGAQVSLREQNRPLISYTYFAGEEEDRTKQRAKAFEAAGMSEILPRDVMLAMTCQIVDFEAAKVKKLDVAPVAVETAPK